MRHVRSLWILREPAMHSVRTTQHRGPIARSSEAPFVEQYWPALEGGYLTPLT
jgi:hypothetical protein